MLCILCISLSDQMLDIFDQSGTNLSISNIITKHFWLEPNPDDNNANSICCLCWNIVESFHTFYKSIEEAHNRFSTLDGNNESNQPAICSNFLTTVEKQGNSHEPQSDLTELPEPTVNQPIDDVVNNDEEEVLNSDCGLKVPLIKLSIRRYSIVEDIYGESSYVTESDSDNALIAEDNCDHQRNTHPGSDSGIDYIVPKKKAKVKGSKAHDNKFGINGIPCKEFDNFIKKNIKLLCDICNEPQENFFCLKEHFKNVHKKDGYVTCCDRQWTSRFSIVHHLILHQNPDLYKCQKCFRVLANKKSFKYHMNLHVIQKPLHSCANCDKSFSTIPKLQKHLKTHFRVDTDQICDQCGKVYHNKQALSVHHKREHLGIVKPRVQCTECGVDLADLSTLKFHIKHLHPKSKVVNACNICGKISATAYGLKRHIKYMHTIERVHKCSICENKSFKTAQILRVRRIVWFKKNSIVK